MSEKRPNIFEQIKTNIALKKETKEMNAMMAFIETTIKNNEGMLIYYDREEETGKLLAKKIIEEQFEYAFHEKIWANMYLQEKIVVLMWLEHYLAEKDNRPEAIFELDFKFDQFNVDYENDNIIFKIPLTEIKNGSLSAYDCALEILHLSVVTKSLNRLERFYNTGKIDDLDENYLKSLRYLKFEPMAYYKLIGAKNVEANPERFTEEEKEYYKKIFTPLTPEEEKDLVFYFLQPYVAELKKESNLLDKFADRNDFYIGKDYTYEAYKEAKKQQEKIADDFLNIKLANKDKKEVFLNLCNEKQDNEMTVEIIK